MYRLKGAPEVDPIIEKQKVRASVKNNILTFVGLCAVIRIAPIILSRVLTNEA